MLMTQGNLDGWLTITVLEDLISLAYLPSQIIRRAFFIEIMKTLTEIILRPYLRIFSE